MRADERLAASGAKSFYLVAYYGHNLHFLAVCNAIAGNSAQAIAAANNLYAHASPMVKEIPPLDGFLYTPAMVLAKFERWNDILALPEPAFEAPISGTVWHFARWRQPNQKLSIGSRLCIGKNLMTLVSRFTTAAS